MELIITDFTGFNLSRYNRTYLFQIIWRINSNCFRVNLQKYFSVKNFKEYKLIFHDRNNGTVSNFYSGLNLAKGKYTKVISPGDYLTHETILYKWICFMEDKHADWSFSKAFYYSDYEKKSFLRKRAHPQYIWPYLKNEKNRCIWSFLAIRDWPPGATIMLSDEF
ncbi:MAG: hypothetical protein IKP88_13065 [Lachnospiraceae bacterium]|nr:hypothetical protein [Lachnospiraceae bacterium]